MNLNTNVTKIALHIMLFTLCILAAGIKADPENEIVAKFADSLIVIPLGQLTSGKEAINNPADPKGELLVNSALSEIRVAFPDYDHSDSIRINQWGDTILRPRLNDYYLLCFPDSLARNQIYDSLSNMDNIISLSEVVAEIRTVA
jgi:hypothetical protein